MKKCEKRMDNIEKTRYANFKLESEIWDGCKVTSCTDQTIKKEEESHFSLMQKMLLEDFAKLQNFRMS